MPLFFESLLAILNGDPSFFVQAIANDLLWFILFILIYWFLVEKRSVLNFAWWTFGLLLFVDTLGVFGVPSFMLSFPFIASVIAMFLFSSISEKWSFLVTFWVLGILGVLFLI